MRWVLLIGVITLHLTISCNAASAVRPAGQSPVPLTTDEIITRINTFSEKVSKAVGKNNDATDGVIFSPISAMIAMLMLSFGSGRHSEQPRFFPLGHNRALTQDGIRSVVNSFDNFTAIELHLANTIFLDRSLQLRPDFQQSTKNTFGTAVQTVNFGNVIEASRTINSWCAQKTKNRIPELFSPAELGYGNNLVLVSAIYFEAKWHLPFEANDTRDREFYGINKLIPTMHKSGPLGYGELPEIKAKFVELPFVSLSEIEDGTSMFIIRPDEKNGINELINNLDKVNLDHLRSTRQFISNVSLYLPQFTIRSTVSLEAPFRDAGLGAFFNQTVFGNMLDVPLPLRINKFVQKAFIEVNEHGATAAAASAARVSLLMGISDPEVERSIEFKVDRPFVCIIGTENRLPLFTAIVLDPSETITTTPTTLAVRNSEEDSSAIHFPDQ